MLNQFSTLCQPFTLFAAWNVVKAKGAAGGVDGVSIKEFESQRNTLITRLVDDLKLGRWKPLPYLQIEVPKKKGAEEKKLFPEALSAAARTGGTDGPLPDTPAAEADRRAEPSAL